MDVNSVKIIENFPHAFAYHEIIKNEEGKPIDYKFINVNEAFEKVTGLKREEILTHKVTKIFPEMVQSEFDWISTYAEVASACNSITFKEYSDSMNKWVEVTAFSDREGFFSTVFRDITKDVLEKKALEEIVELSEHCLHNDHETLNYHKVSTAVRKISRGTQVKFELYREDKKDFIQAATAGKKILETAGGCDDTIYVKMIEKEGKVFGKLTILMHPEEPLQNEEYLQILTGILSQYFDRQKIHEKLRQENEQLFLLFDHIDEPIYVVDMDTYQILYVNDAGKEDFGDIQGKTCWKVMHPGQEETCTLCPISELKDKKNPMVTKREEYYHKEKKRWYQRTDTVIDWPGARRVKLTMAFDVSDRKEAEKQEQYLRTVMANAHDSIIVTDGDFTITYINKKTEELFGYRSEELIGEKVGMLYPESERKKVQRTIFPILKSGKKYSGELHTKRKDGGSFYCEISVSPMDGGNKKMGGYIGIQRDITEKKRMLDELNRSNERYNELARQSGTITWETDETGLYTYVNPIVKEVYGYSPEELIGKVCFYDLFMDEEKSKLKKKFFEVFSKKDSFVNFINATKGKNGEAVIVSTNGMPIVSREGTLKGYKGVDTDITERILMEEQNYMEQEKFRTTLLSVGDGIIATDELGSITVMNKIAQHLTGWTQEEAYGKPFETVFRIIHEETKKPCKNPAKHVLLTGDTVELAENTALITKSGNIVPIEDSASPIKGKGGKVTGAVIVFRDYTEKREKEREVEYLSFHDHLTGFYNRRYMDDAFIRLDEQQNFPIALITVDVNGLKLTNDAYGHDMGDKLLKAVAAALNQACRTGDIVSRVGGDEFVILLPQTSYKQAESVQSRIKSLSRRINLDSVIVSLAIGFAVKNEEEQNLWDVLKLAENRMYKNKVKHGKVMRSKTIETVLRSINNKYDKEQIHTERVSLYCEAIAKALELSNQDIERIKTIGVLHDIGKITVSPDILNKKTKLTEEEWNQIKQHPVTGYNILKGVEEYQSFADSVLHHHERWDGRGYPTGLKGEEIPYFARIVTVVDAFEAMTAKRAYQRMKTNEEAIEELKRCAGIQFDPEIVRVFVEKVLKGKF